VRADERWTKKSAARGARGGRVERFSSIFFGVVDRNSGERSPNGLKPGIGRPPSVQYVVAPLRGRLGPARVDRRAGRPREPPCPRTALQAGRRALRRVQPAGSRRPSGSVLHPFRRGERADS